MARAINRLSARGVQTTTKAGRYADGGGLYLVVSDDRPKKWVFIYSLSGKRRNMGLGAVLTTPLAEARKLADEARALVKRNVDPIEARRAVPQAAAPVPQKPPTKPTFGQVADEYIRKWEKTWKNPAHRRQWRQTLEHYAASLWDKPVDEVDTPAVLAVLEGVWHTHADTGKRLRGRIERILDAAKVKELRTGENPARWRGHLDLALPPPRRLTRGHHKAMPYAEVPAFLKVVRDRPGMSARALEFLILTAARSGEVRGMVWREVDTEDALWIVAAGRMKTKRQHRVPLSADALAVLDRVRPETQDLGAFVFPNTYGGEFSDMAFKALLKRAGEGGVTAHGFRSAFRDWVEDETDHPTQLAEAALSHLVGTEVERAYRRGDALVKRRALMDHWAAFCAGETSASKSE